MLSDNEIGAQQNNTRLQENTTLRMSSLGQKYMCVSYYTLEKNKVGRQDFFLFYLF